MRSRPTSQLPRSPQHQVVSGVINQPATHLPSEVPANMQPMEISHHEPSVLLAEWWNA